MAELYRAENTSQFAGILPALAQAPVLSVVYTLFVRNTIDGHANALLAQQLFAAPLGGSFLHLLAGGGVGILVYLALFCELAAVAWISRRIALRLQLVDTQAPASAATLARALSLAAIRDDRVRRVRAAGRSPVPGSIRNLDSRRADAAAPLVLARP